MVGHYTSVCLHIYTIHTYTKHRTVLLLLSIRCGRCFVSFSFDFDFFFFILFDFALLRLAACGLRMGTPSARWINGLLAQCDLPYGDEWIERQTAMSVAVMVTAAATRTDQTATVRSERYVLELHRVGVLPLFIYILFYVLSFTSNFKIVSFDRNLQHTPYIQCTLHTAHIVVLVEVLWAYFICSNSCTEIRFKKIRSVWRPRWQWPMRREIGHFRNHKKMLRKMIRGPSPTGRFLSKLIFIFGRE